MLAPTGCLIQMEAEAASFWELLEVPPRPSSTGTRKIALSSSGPSQDTEKTASSIPPPWA
uniref:Uncharacterized protein n=1 Tax=Arundo donax TaxID=35708 RepID=A0A0A9GKC1_ARUDO